MIITKSTSDLLKVNASVAVDLDVQVSGIIIDKTTTPPGALVDGIRKNTKPTASGDTTISDALGSANYIGNFKFIAIYNIDTTDTGTIYVHLTDGTTDVRVSPKMPLAPGESAIYNDGTWFVFDVNGAVKAGAPAASDTVAGIIQIATQADQEAGSSLILAVTPGRQQYHPSAAKFWAQVTGAGTPSLTTNYNVTSIADTGVGRMTVTINADFSSANWCCQITTFQSTTTGDEGIPNIDAKAAGTVEAGNRIITPAFADPVVGYDVVGYGDQ